MFSNYNMTGENLLLRFPSNMIHSNTMKNLPVAFPFPVPNTATMLGGGSQPARYKYATLNRVADPYTCRYGRSRAQSASKQMQAVRQKNDREGDRSAGEREVGFQGIRCMLVRRSERGKTDNGRGDYGLGGPEVTFVVALDLVDPVSAACRPGLAIRKEALMGEEQLTMSADIAQAKTSWMPTGSGGTPGEAVRNDSNGQVRNERVWCHHGVYARLRLMGPRPEACNNER